MILFYFFNSQISLPDLKFDVVNLMSLLDNFVFL